MNAFSWPSLDNFWRGSASHTVFLSSMYSKIFLEHTKNPPLILPPSPFGFSIKPSTKLSLLMLSAPNLPGGYTAVTVAYFFEFMCDSDLEKYIDDNASLTKSGEYLLAVIKKWLKDNVVEVEWEGEKARLWTPWTK